MAADSGTNFVSLLLVGDSHVIGFQPQTFSVEISPGKTSLLQMDRIFVDPAFAAMDMVVTFPDGRTGLNPIFEQAMTRWPGLDIKGRPTTEGAVVEKQLVLSVGCGLSAYDPAIDFADRAADRLTFRDGIDYVLPERPEIPTDAAATILPAALIRDMFENILRPMKQALALIAPRYPERVWLIGAPPPSRDNSILCSLITSRAAKTGIPPELVALPSSTVLLKNWLIIRKIVKDMCRETGCSFIDSAPIACDDAGFLRPELCHDGVHGNVLYHNHMTRHIILKIAAASFNLPEKHPASA